MKLSTETSSLGSRFGDLVAIDMLAEAGFDALDYSMYAEGAEGPAFGDDYQQYAAKLRRAARDSGLSFRQAHAPFGYCFGDYQDPKLIEKTKRAIEFAGLLDVRQIVVHPICCDNGMDQLAYNMDFFGQFDPICEEFGIQIAIENMWGYDRERYCFYQNVCSNPEELARYVDAMGKNFCACLDVGHCVLVREDPARAVRKLGNARLQALHIHDNGYTDDDHWLPYSGKMDWESLMKALSEIGYQGDLTLEALTYMKHYPDDFALEAMKYAAKVGRYLIAKFNCK